MFLPNAIVDGVSETVENRYDNIYIKNFDFGPKAGVIYKLNEKLAIEGTYYYGINNLLKGDPILWKSKIQQLTLGIRYTLWTKEVNI